MQISKRCVEILQHEYLVEKIGVDTAENGPSKVLGNGGSTMAVSGVIEDDITESGPGRRSC